MRCGKRRNLEKLNQYDEVGGVILDRPNLYQVLPTDDFKVYLYYDNGEIKLYDCAFVLNGGKIFDKIKDINEFKRLCTIMNRTLAFDISEERDPCNCIDVCPDTIYAESAAVQNDILTA